jgi:hypothetical protein
VAKFNQNGTNLIKISLGKGNSSLFNKGPGLSQSGDNHKNVKIGWGHLKIFSRTTQPEKLKFT